MKRMIGKRIALGLLLALSAALLASCQGETLDSYIGRMAETIRVAGYDCKVLPSEKSLGEVDVPIYDSSVWRGLEVEGERLYVYFDSSNRAPQLAQQFGSGFPQGRTVAYGMRYILYYPGQEEAILQLLDWLNEEA